MSIKLVINLLAFLSLSSSQDDADAPVFEPLFSVGEARFTITERPREGMEVGLVRALGNPRETVYYGLEENGGLFEVGIDSGEITVGSNGPDSLVISGAPLSVSFIAFAYYQSAGLSGKRSNLSVTVEVQDTNDSPYFDPTIETDYTFIESVEAGVVLQRFTATDNDLGTNSALEYSLQQIQPSGETEESFSIHRYTGDLSVTQALSLGDEFLLTITVRDEGDPPLAAQINVSVRIDPPPPTISQSVYEVHLLEFTKQDGVSILNVSATVLGDEDIKYKVSEWSPAPRGLNFSMGTLTGELVASGTLDRETFSRYTITIEAYVYIGSESKATVVLHVLDVNEPPQFSRTHYSAAVAEGAELGYLFYSSILASDGDTGSGGVLTYSITNTSGQATFDGTTNVITNDIFSIHSTTADLYVNYDLEREAEVDGYHYYELIVIATDGGSPPLSSSSVVAVTVIDVNDNPPMFTALQYDFEILESVGNGTAVGIIRASDRDEGAAANLTFSLSGSANEHFRINVEGISSQNLHSRSPIVTTARVYTVGQLDREEMSQYELTVIAQDTTDQPLIGSSQVTITVLDYNDNAPMFSQDTFDFGIEEEALIGGDGLIGSIIATDADEGSNAEVDFSLALTASESQFFSVETINSTATLTLLQTLDRETDSSYSFRLLATDRGSPSLVGEATINITVLDVNDQTPMFSMDNYEVNVTENEAAGLPLVTVSASDGDIDENAEIVYSIGNGNGGGVVSVDGETGEVVLVGPLDHEEASRWDIEVLATDSGTTQLIGSATIVINVEDVNDNAPVFGSGVYTVMVYENVTIGAELIRLTAEDADSGERGSVRYQILTELESDQFAVDETTGSVTVVAPLDRETTEEYHFSITATDMGSPALSSTAELMIIVIDVNDHSPVFELTSYSVQVSEGVIVNSSLGMELVTVRATDADAGFNGEISYHLLGSEAERFHVNSTSGLVTVAIPLDYESYFEPYTLTVVARDNGEVRRTAVASLEITVLDANDIAPAFVNLPYVVRLNDGTTGPALVLTAEARDPEEGENGEVEYILSGGGGLFMVDRTSGNISVTAGTVVDREGDEVEEMGDEGEGIIYLTLTAVDDGSPIQLTQTTVTLLILDVNDNSPVFQQNSYSTSVSEALSTGSHILNVLATDSDYGLNASVIYSITQQLPPTSTDIVFEIDSQTGVISLSSPLDRESNDLFSLTVSASDRGTPSLTSSVVVVINVTDANDNHPVFTIPSGGYTASVHENIPLGTEVITVAATDRDLGLHSQITYSLRDSAVPFQIPNPEVGLIIVSGLLDREIIPEYRLIVVASDTPANSNATLQAEAEVVIMLLDINDSPPQFVASSFEGTVDENLPINSTVYLFPELLAVDPDTSSDGVVVYTLTGTDSQYFTLDPVTARLFTNVVFDAEIKHTYNNLLVVAVDNDGLNSTTPLTVLIGDENEFSPFFTSGADEMVLVSESLSPGGVVIVMAASDSDGRRNSLNFTLTSYRREGVEGELTSGNPFLIDSSTGAILVSENGLDFELSSYYELTVVVEDNGVPPLSNYTQVLVELMDVNDNPPALIPQNQSFHIQENIPIGSVVGTVLASDLDSPELTQLEFHIISGNESGLFVINATTGEIVTVGEVDREEEELHTLSIEVRDGQEFFLYSRGTAIITVGDINDQYPTFPSLSSAEIEEEMPIATPVIDFGATDGDAEENGTLFYIITSSLPEEHFTINPLTGEVLTSVQLDRETHTTYYLTIEARDGGTPSLTGTANLTVAITDINDNQPQFTGSSEATIIEHPFPGSLVSSNYSAIDSDQGSNAELMWEIVNGNVLNAFRVDPMTGGLSVQNSSELDFEVTPVFFLEMRVTDLGQSPLSNSLLVRVSLLDTNDHPPVITPFSLPITISEDTPIDSIVAVVTATDEDEGTNAEIEYVIISGNVGGVFGTRSDGSIRIELPLDHETVPIYSLDIEARDGGDPPMIDSVTVIVNVTDVNDNAPQFVEVRLSGPIPENRASPEIATVTISDPDSGSNGLYDVRVVSANGGNPSPFFAIFNFISAEGLLDYEEQTQYTLVLEVEDRGSPPLTTQTEIVVDIMDIDDNPPTFTEPPHYVISETQEILTPFEILETEDRDSLANSRAYYYITGGATREYFDVISQTGQLYLNQPVDRETQAEHELEITAQSFLGDASDCTEITCSVTTLTVTILDVNDNVPQWILGEYIIGVNETTALNTVIGRLEAVDGDAEDFGLVWYRLSEGEDQLITVEEESGVLRLNRSLDTLQSRVSEVLTAVAFDNRGLSPSSSSMNVPITIVSLSVEYLVIITVEQSLEQVQADINSLQRSLEVVSGARLAVFDIRERQTQQSSSSGTQQTKRQSSGTEVIVFGLSSEGGMLLTSQETLEVVSENTRVLFGDMYTITNVTVSPKSMTEDESDGIDNLTLTIVVASIVVAVLVIVLLLTFCGCCWLQSRLKQKRKHYDPSRRSESGTHSNHRERVRYSTAEGFEYDGGWASEHARVEDDMFQLRNVNLRGGKGRRDRATDSGTRPWDSRESEEIRRSVLYESNDFVMNVFEDSDGDEGEDEPENLDMFAPTEEGYGERYHDEGRYESREEENYTLQPQSYLESIQEAEEEEEEEDEEEEEEGEAEEEEDDEWVDETTGAEVWEEGEEWDENEPSPADMMTEDDARMLAAPLDDDSPTTDAFLF